MLELHKHDVSFVCQLVEDIRSRLLHLQPALEPVGVNHQTSMDFFEATLCTVSPSRAVPSRGCCKISLIPRTKSHAVLVKREL